ncbi:MAG: radical SAM protein [Clostridia bacterium]|nr:radical SAM protein [Clostridia bacterium]
MAKCTLCPRRCGADREVRPGVCGVRSEMRVAGIMLHHWEEPCLSGNVEDGRGSGAVFFTGCPLHCVFCQNGGISDGGNAGKAYAPRELADAMLDLQNRGAYNINLVSPTQFTDGIIEAVAIARPRLTIPVVWNTGGYERAETVRRLDGTVDVYLTDFKYGSERTGRLYANAPDYAAEAAPALAEMFRQTGAPVYDDFPDKDTVDHPSRRLRRGVILRHLVLPGERLDSVSVLRTVAETVPSRDVILALMRQYTPDFAPADREKFPHLGRRVTSFEYESVLREAIRLGFDGFTQEKKSAAASFTPEFARKTPAPSSK